MERLILLAIAVIRILTIVVGIFIAFKFKGFFHKIISLGLIISVLFAWIDNRYALISILIMILLAMTTFIYGLTIKDIHILERISIIVMGLFLTVSPISKLMHWPVAGQLKLLMILPIIITLASFIKCRKLTKEMSFMILWLYYALLTFLRFWIY